MNHTIYLLLGSNLGNRPANIQNAIGVLAQQAGPITRASHIYESKAWGVNNQPDYLNAAVELQTSIEALPLLLLLEEVERGMGRIFKRKMEPRTLDIDILFYDDLVFQHSSLTIPHPRMHLRRFALIPMAELNSAFIHPVFHKTIAELIEQCPDDGEVKAMGTIEIPSYSNGLPFRL